MRTVPYPHPGEVLREEFLEPLEITAYRLARDIAVPQTRIGEILAGRRGISVDTALRLSRYFGQSDAFWINLQRDYEIAVERDLHGAEIAKIKPWSNQAA